MKFISRKVQLLHLVYLILFLIDQENSIAGVFLAHTHEGILGMLLGRGEVEMASALALLFCHLSPESASEYW